MGRGALVFKGEKGAAKKKPKKSKHHPRDEEKISAAAAASDASASVLPAHQQRVPLPGKEEQLLVPKIKRGSGTITTSGTVVTGYETRFMKEIGVGDALLVDVVDDTNNSQQQEMRVVTMRLSDVSLNLSSAFSRNMATPATFQYIGKPRDVAKEAATAQQRATLASAEEERHHASGSAGELVYRERTEHGNYRTKRVKVDGARNRSDLLELRSKKTSDKYC